MTLLGHTLPFRLEAANIRDLFQRFEPPLRRLAEVLHPTMQAPRRHPQPYRHVTGRAPPSSDLLDRLALEPIRIRFARMTPPCNLTMRLEGVYELRGDSAGVGQSGPTRTRESSGDSRRLAAPFWPRSAGRRSLLDPPPRGGGVYRLRTDNGCVVWVLGTSRENARRQASGTISGTRALSESSFHLLGDV